MSKKKNKNKSNPIGVTVTLQQLEEYAKRNPKGKVAQSSSIADVVITAQTNKVVYITLNREPNFCMLSREEYWRPIWAHREKRLYILAGSFMNGYKVLHRKKRTIGSIMFSDEELNKRIKSLSDCRMEGMLHIDENGMFYVEVPFTRI